MTDTITAWLDSASKARKLDKNGTLEALKKLETLEAGSPAYQRLVNRICESNLLLIANTVRNYLRRRVSLRWNDEATLDLLQQGYFGLKRSVEKFDVKKDCTFSTYAVQWIRQSINRYTNDTENMVRIPESTLNQVFHLNKHGELQDRKGVTKNIKLIRQAQCALSPASLDAPANDEGDSLGELIPSIKQEPTPIKGEHTWASRMLEDKMAEAGIYGEAADIVRAYAHHNRMPIVAARLGISLNVVRPILKASIKKLEAIA